MVSAGDRAPELRLTAAVSGRPVTAAEGRRLVLVFHGPRTTEAPKLVGKAVRAAHPDPHDVLVANVVDLRSMGGLWRKVAEGGLKSNYEKMAEKVEAAGGDPAEFVVICPDWDGAACLAFGVPAANERPAVAVLAPDGTLVGMAREGDLAAQAVTWLQ